MVYRSTPHTTAGVSPAKLLFGRKIRTKVPCLKREVQQRDGVAEKDKLMKDKGKIYSDYIRHATDSQVEIGDAVLLKNTKQKNKLSATFEDELYKVKEKNGLMGSAYLVHCVRRLCFVSSDIFH